MQVMPDQAFVSSATLHLETGRAVTRTRIAGEPASAARRPASTAVYGHHAGLIITVRSKDAASSPREQVKAGSSPGPAAL